MNMAVEYQRERVQERVLNVPRVSAATKVRSRSAAVTAKRMMTMVVAFSMLFCVLVGLVYIKYLVAETQLSINDIQVQIHEAGNEQTRLQETLERVGSVQMITERAEALGMSQPTAGQILYIHLPEETAGESMTLENGK